MSGWRMGIDEDPAEYNECEHCGATISLCSCRCRDCGKIVVDNLGKLFLVDNEGCRCDEDE